MGTKQRSYDPLLTISAISATVSACLLIRSAVKKKCPASLPSTSVIKTLEVPENLEKPIESLLNASARINKLLRSRIGSDTTQAGSSNLSGDDQLKLDIACDEACFDEMRRSGVYEIGASEETPEEVDLKGSGFSCGFDPLDGSSVIGSNFTIGSIFGVFPGRGVVGRKGREMCLSGLSVYGPRTTFLLAVSGCGVWELTLVDDNRWIVSKEKIKIQEEGKVFMPGNLRASNEDEGYGRMVRCWIEERYTLRYTGAMVAEVNYILTKGKGVFCNVSSSKAKAKLRLLYECAPIAFIVTLAGGMAIHEDTKTSVLDVTIEHLDQRCGLCLGSAKEVEKFLAIVK